MKNAFTYHDEKSKKFWWIDYSGCDFVVNYGKTGVTGKYEIKEFESEEECIKQAEKLITQKLKKGYQIDNHFDFIDHLYFDDEEIGLHPKTSHPHFVKHFTDDFYYDCTDEEAPFGSDEGSDALSILTENMRNKSKLNFADFPKYIIENEWGMKYIPVSSLIEDQVKKIAETDEMNMTQSDMITYAIAFGQIKITGGIDPKLKQCAIDSMKRIKITAKILNWGEDSEILSKMIEDLTSF
ncbi:WGR domain-containing protein [Paenibacillus sp. SYP-B3998]|uniref:WGR domain-containing protein n=1 Tax=Paenibacillus sp. SYP-B3998 TaxID=2678564 RepID=A0A6G3ZTY4_9BACL|nr:WGR domain-containing protein [Paenibacillus sp. SYP-B3998]